jgi:hypothetical protein
MSMPVSPTGAGEGGGGGMETLRLDGERWRSYRYAHGFEMNREVGEDDVAEQRNYILESMDFLFDLNAIFGMQNTEDWNGLFDEVRSRIPAERTFDCEDFDGEVVGVSQLEAEALAVEATPREHLILGRLCDRALLLVNFRTNGHCSELVNSFTAHGRG